MHKKVQFKTFGSSVKPSCPPAGNVEETSEFATKIKDLKGQLHLNELIKKIFFFVTPIHLDAQGSK